MKDWSDEGGRRTAPPPPSQAGPVVVPPYPGVAERRLRELTEQVEHIRRQLSETHELEAVVSGLEPDQEIRAWAAELAVNTSPQAARRLVGAPHTVPAAWQPHPLDVARAWADWIQIGGEPDRIACTCSYADASPIERPVSEFVRGEPDPTCPHHGSRP